MSDKVSIVTVCYNAASVIEKTIKSVIEQKYSNVEFVVLDGGSTDGTIDILNNYKRNIDILISERDKGVYDAMNKSIDLVTGEWIIFMNAGDKFANANVIHTIFEGQTYDNYSVVFGNPIIVYSQAKFERNDRPQESGYISVNHQCAFTRKKELQNYRFDLQYKLAADANLFKMIQDSGGGFKYVDIPIAEYEHLDGMSSRKRMELNSEIGKIYNYSHNLRWYIRCLLIYKQILIRKIFGDALFSKMMIRECERSSKYKKI